MDVRDLLELSGPRLVITGLLIIYCAVTLPIMSVHQTICQEEQVDCSSQEYHAPLYYCAVRGFEKEFHTLYLYSLEICDKQDGVWLILIIPFLYMLSYYLYERWERAIDAWRFGLKPDLITLFLIICTLFPAFLFGIGNTRVTAGPLTAYTLSPLIFFYRSAQDLISDKAIYVLILLGGLLLLMYGIYIVLKAWEIPHPLFYTVWIFYLITCSIGSVMI